MTAPDLSDYERAVVERIEAAPDAGESLRSRLIRATHAAACDCGEEDPSWSRYWQKIADAAIAMIRGDPVTAGFATGCAACVCGHPLVNHWQTGKRQCMACPDGGCPDFTPRPAAPDVSTDTGALREALEADMYQVIYRVQLARGIGMGHDGRLAMVDNLLDLPALRDLIAERDQAVAAVQRVREVADDYEGYVKDRGRPVPGTYDHGLNMAQAAAAFDLRRALDDQ